MTKHRRYTMALILLVLLAACGQADPGTPSPGTPVFNAVPSATATRDETPAHVIVSPTATFEASPTVNWQDLPVVPASVSQRTRQVYELGLELHNKPNVFSIVGDCLSTPTYFLTNYDSGLQYYNLGPYGELQGVIDQFQGSFSRVSVAVGRGFNAATELSPLWADPNVCNAGESPLECELRLNQPAFAFVLLGTNDVKQPGDFDGNLRQILDLLVGRGVVPILATKADNQEGDQHINLTIVRLAQEYELPLWNFWLAVQPLPDHGLKEDGIHLTWADKNYDFSNPASMETAWPWRNLTFLQTLDSVWRLLQSP